MFCSLSLFFCVFDSERKDQIEKAEEEDRLKKEKEGKEKNETEVNKGNHDEKKTDEDNGDGRYETEETDRSDDKVTEGLYDHKTETMEDSASEQVWCAILPSSL